MGNDNQTKDKQILLKRPFAVAILATLCCLLWGSAFPAIKLGYQFALGGLVMVCVGYVTGGRLSTWNGKGAAILIYLAFVSAIAYTLWSLLLRYNDVSKVAVYGCLNPVFGAILSALILREAGQNFGIKEVIALILISIGIFIVQKKGTVKC